MVRKSEIRGCSVSPFADFIRNANAREKKRVFGIVLLEATKRQNEVLARLKQPVQKWD